MEPSSPPQSGTAALIFGPCLLWPNGWMDQDATWYEDRRQCHRSSTATPNDVDRCPKKCVFQFMFESLKTIFFHVYIDTCLISFERLTYNFYLRDSARVLGVVVHLHDSLGTLVFLVPYISAKLKRGHPQWRQRRRQIQVGWVKCSCGS